MTNEPARKDSKMWIARKIYICKITGEACDDERHPMTDQGPDCSDCEVYEEWKQKIDGDSHD